MALTEAQARAKVLAEARKHAGYNPGRTYSKFGDWYGWPNALWCAAYASYVFYQALGATDGRKVIGNESTAPHGRGWIWTVAFRRWLQANGTRVSLANAQPMDLLFFKFPTSDGRNNNAVNHVDVIEVNHAFKGYLATLGGNTSRPGSGGDPSNGRGVWRHNRALNNPYIVDVYRPNWRAIVGTTPPPTAPPALTDRVKTMLSALGYPATPAGVRAYQSNNTGAPHRLSVDGKVGPLTTAALEADMSTLAKIEKDVADLRALLITRTTVDVSEGTAKNMNTGRTGPQPLGWFVGVIGNRIGRSDIRIAAMSRDFPTYPDRVWRVGLPDGQGGTVQAQSYLRGGNAKAQNASAAARAGLELQTQIADAQAAAIARAATEVVEAVKDGNPANPEAIEQAVQAALERALRAVATTVTFEVEEAPAIDEVAVSAAADPVGDED